MMTEVSTDTQLFQEMLERLYEKSILDHTVEKNKEKAWQRFQEMGLPTRKEEVFQYIRLRSFYGHSFEITPPISVQPENLKAHILPECSQSVLVLVNGNYCPELSCLKALPKRVVILPLKEAMKTYGNFLSNQWNKLLKEENDPFVLLNAALYQQGLFIYAPPKTILDVPIQILHVSTFEENSLFIAPRIQGFIGSQSQLNILSTYAHLSGKGYFLTATIDLAIDEDSHVKYFQTPLSVPSEAWYFDAFRATLKRNSTLKTVLVSEGSTSSRHDYRITLAGENAEARLNGIWMLEGSREAHAHILMEHQVPHCRSMQFFKTVLDDASRSSFEGKILVQRPAQKTEAFQLNNNLLLSEKAIAYSKPNLEIFADDVKASHGATFGQLDQEQLFYLRTRGYTESAAKNLLVHGFCKEIIDLIPYQSLTEMIDQRLKSYLAQDSKG